MSVSSSPPAQPPGRDPIRVLFVCTGNICRSPTAQAVFCAQVAARGLDRYLQADSAGISDYHQGDAPDERSMEAAARRGYDMRSQRARQVRQADATMFDYIVALDETHRRALGRALGHALAGCAHRARVLKLMDCVGDERAESASADPVSRGLPGDVPDPYYGGADGFEHVLDLIEAGCQGLIERILAEHDLGESDDPTG